MQKPNIQIKDSLQELSLSIHCHIQALDNAVAEIEYLERQNEQLKYQIQFAYTLPNGEYLTLEELAQNYSYLLLERGE